MVATQKHSSKGPNRTPDKSSHLWSVRCLLQWGLTQRRTMED
jgi:hypothetical protein